MKNFEMSTIQLSIFLTVYQSLWKNCHSQDTKTSSLKPPLDEFRRQGEFYLGPPRSEHYDPNYGFEPYWMGGKWVFNRIEVTTVKPSGSVCGEPCAEMYKKFGMVCGRNKDQERKQFNNYCELLDEDCTGRKEWRILYRGECRDLELYISRLSTILTRAKTFEATFNSIQEMKRTTTLFIFTGVTKRRGPREK